MSLSATNIQQKLCLATVSSKDYWPGTKVMIKSFLEYNLWFRGDIIIITRDSLVVKKASKYFRNVIEKKPSGLLQQSIESVCHSLPKYNLLRNRFHIFEVFTLEGYDRVFYADSDILFRNELNDNLFSEKLMASYDPSFFRGFVRDRNSCKKIHTSNYDPEKCYAIFFNSGFLSIEKKHLNNTTFKGLVANINQNTFAKIKDLLADEPVLNKYFEGQISPLDASLNTSVHLITERSLTDSNQNLHYTGKYKPWKLLSWLVLPLRSPAYLRYLTQWLFTLINNKF
jgi:lipopolysaccharide biosynthesis glycosyltransferase